MSWVETLRGSKGNKVGPAIRELYRAEKHLAAALLTLADLHKADHEIFYVARDVARWSHEHVRALADVGARYGLDLDPEPEGEPTLLARLRQKGAEALGRFHEPSLSLLAELRRVHRTAAGVSLDWEVLAQTAQALKDAELLALAQNCHPQTIRQMRWANAKVKETAAQVMVTA